MKWQALTQPGALAWNVHRSRLPAGGYQGGVKRRPRAEWVIQEDVHEALISKAEAEIILTNLETSSEKRRRRTPAAYLLSGLLETPDGDPWHGEVRGPKRYYYAKGRGHGRTIPANLIEDAVVSRVCHEMRSKAFVRSLTLAAARRIYRQQPKTSLGPIRAEIAAIEARISRTLELAEGLTDSAPALRRVDVLETERNAAVARLRLAERDTAAARTLAGVTEESIGELLQDLLHELDEDREHAKEVLRRAIDRIVVDPTERTVQVHYHLAARDKMASPRVHDLIPLLEASGAKVGFL